jgi:hypothetical protein
MSGTSICTQWSDMLIFAWVNYLCSKIRVLCVDVFRESLEWRSGAKQKIKQLGIPVGSVCLPWLVVSVFRHVSLSNSLLLSFGDNFFWMVFIWKILLLVFYSVFKCAFMLHKSIFIEDTLNMFSKWLVSMLTLKLSTSVTGTPSLTPCHFIDILLCYR